MMGGVTKAASFLSLILLLGCESAPSPNEGEAEKTARDRVAGGAEFFLAPGESTLALTIEARDGTVTRLQTSATGFAELSADSQGDLVLEQLDLAFDDAIVGDKTQPDAIRLTDITAGIEERAPCSHAEWSSGDELCTAIVPTEIAVSWSLHMTDGMTVPLPDLRLPMIDYSTHVWRDKALVMDFAGRGFVSLWQRSDLFDITTITLAITGYEIVPMLDK